MYVARNELSGGGAEMGRCWYALHLGTLPDLRVLTLALVLVYLPFAAHAQEEEAIAPPAANLSSRTTIPESKAKRALVRWKVGLDYSNFENQTDQAQQTGFALGGDLRYKIVQMLELKASTSVGLSSGYAQTRFGEFTPSSGVNLNEALIRFRPIKEFSLSAGAISQSYLHAPLLVAGGPFLGGIERLVLGGDALSVELITQQSIPTSAQLTTKAVESEATPSFFVETLQLSTKAISHLKLFTYGGHFAFRNLPSSVAFESSAYGNQVLGDTVASSRFAFPFEGWLAGAGTRIQFAEEFGITLEGQMLQNTQAPENFRNGQMASSTMHIQFSRGVLVEPTAMMFFSESDLSPAYYNAASYGHNNRQGWEAGIDTTVKEAGFKVGGRYVDADVINQTPYQTRQQYFKIVFETLYEML
jgi:hypothetical protein